MDRSLAVVVTVALLAATPGLAGAVVGVLGPPGSSGPAPSAVVATPADSSDHTIDNESTGVATQAGTNRVNVTTGSQLSTVLAATEANVSAGVSQSTFERRFRQGNETERANATAARASALRREASALDAAYRNVTDAFRDGRIDRETYARRVASLHARAGELRASLERLRDRARTVSDLALAVAGFDESTLAAAESDLDAVSGASMDALFRRFSGQSNGSVDVSAGDGISVAVETDDGERTREVRWPADDNRTVTIRQATALRSARAVFQRDEWVLEAASVDDDEGYYAFEFALATANVTGEAEVRVDGSSGRVVRLDQETEERDADEDRDDDDRESGSLVLLVVAGDPAPNATVTLEARRNGSVAADVPVYVDGDRVGVTDADGRLDVTLGVEETRIEADNGAESARLEFEFDDTEDLRNLTVDATLTDGTVTVSVTYRGDGVEGAAVSANSERVGTTGEDGSVSFPLGNETRVDIEVTKGEFELDRRYYVDNASLTREEPDGEDEEEQGETGNETADRTLELSVVDGDPAVNATVTVRATVNGTGVGGAVVTVDDERIGTTDGDGRINVTLYGERTEVTATYDDLEAELEFRFDDDDSDDDDSDDDDSDDDDSDDDSDDDEEAED